MPQSPHSSFLNVLSHVVVLATNSSKTHGAALDAPSCLSVCHPTPTPPLPSPSVIPPPPIPHKPANNSWGQRPLIQVAPLQGGVKHQGLAGNGSHLPAKEGRQGAASPPEQWMPTLSSLLPGHLGKMLPCSAAISLPNWRNASILPSCSSALLVPEQMITEMEHMGPKVTGHSGKVTLCYPRLRGRGPSAPEHSFSLCSSQGREVASPEPPENKMHTL